MIEERDYVVCELCEAIVLLEDAFAYADERMAVCRGCDTAVVWRVGAGPADQRQR